MTGLPPAPMAGESPGQGSREDLPAGVIDNASQAFPGREHREVGAVFRPGPHGRLAGRSRIGTDVAIFRVMARGRTARRDA